jgi:xanthosine utilization system XapX-like protein
MAFVKWLAVLPFLGILVGVPLLNRVQPLVLGMPLILAWIVLWIVLTAVIMGIIYLCDPANRDIAEPRP